MRKAKPATSPSEVLTVRLPAPLKERLERLSEATARSKSWLAVDAITQYLELEEWQVQETRAGLEEADRGELASSEEVDQVFSRWRR